MKGCTFFAAKVKVVKFVRSRKEGGEFFNKRKEKNGHKSSIDCERTSTTICNFSPLLSVSFFEKKEQILHKFFFNVQFISFVEVTPKVQSFNL